MNLADIQFGETYLYGKVPVLALYAKLPGIQAMKTDTKEEIYIPAMHFGKLNEVGVPKKKKPPVAPPDVAALKIAAAANVSGFKFPDEEKILNLVQKLKSPRTTAYKENSRLGWILRPSAFSLTDSAKTAEEDAHQVVWECVRQIGGEYQKTPVVIDNETGFEYGETNVNVFKNKKIVLWLRTSQPNGPQQKAWVEWREKAFPVLFPGYEIITTMHGEVYNRAPDLLTHAPSKVWETLTGHPGAYWRIEELLAME